MKYILLNERKEIKPHNGQKKVVLYRIVALQDFTTYAFRRKVRCEEGKRTVFYQIEEKQIKVGDKGGYVQSMKNLSQKGSCWIDDEAFAFGNASVEDESYLGDHAGIGGHVKLRDNTKVTDFVQIGGEITLRGRSKAIGSGSYYDKGTFRDSFLGKNIIQTPQPTNVEKKEYFPLEKPLGKIKIECVIDGKKIINDFEF